MAESEQPLVDPEEPRDPSAVLMRNIRALRQQADAEDKRSGWGDRIADVMTAFTGSMSFAVIHLLIVACWIVVNIGLVPWLPAFDQSFIILATAASVEAIFLSTFVLISQNRASVVSRRQAALDLQINLLTEHELTRVLRLVRAMAEQLGVKEAQDESYTALERHIAPEKVLERIAEDEQNHQRS
ncbi:MULTISPECIES: DUF1003 domain-containing protein [unclassified Chelatococcus]|uniref:DUF1003 domain-containing protein n=1 Tax=unclassified Chelatococcus TaxID=2638111 RepID=UPI001BD0A437|nr:MULTISPECIES: DUF1003 domain-containing protein [unclassified Chelatococcus]MBS7700069.1 DUF1003 domain-containing protein [Chelatococcus sp. YT9]MBX3556762.1 DUF1003 domain-containing protein [Chelatococcus sp.]